jgi:anaerobic selenocysteine-containing dehydrogenase
MVMVETLRGGVGIRARCTPSILPGVISMSHGWDEANANILTDDACLDPISGFPGGRCLLARVSRE